MDGIVEKKPPDWVIDSLERSEAQIAKGETVPLEPVLDRLRASIARMKTKGSVPAPKSARKA